MNGTPAAECGNDNSPADWTVTIVQADGQSFTHEYCAECAFGLAGWIFPNNDEGFAGAGAVAVTVTYTFLHRAKYEAMAKEGA